MVSGAAQLRTGVVLIADETSLRRLGPTTALASAWERVGALSVVDEVLIVTDSEAVRAIATAWGARCSSWNDVGPVAWSGVADSGTEVTAARAKAGAKPSIIPPSVVPLKGTELVASPSALDTRDDATGALWAGLRLDVVVFLDVAFPLWDAADLQAVVNACERGSRAFLASDLGTSVWAPDSSGGLGEMGTPACAELSTLRGFRLSEGAEAGPQPVLVSSYKGWSLRDPVERLGIEAAWAQMQQQSKVLRLPSRVAALVMDFDGVLTDNRVSVDQNGVESVICHRGDGMGLELLRKAGVPLLVISKEKNPVVRARCNKLQIPCVQGVDDKLTALRGWAAEHGYEREQLVFVGNDVNDLECLEWVGCAVVVQDSHPDVSKIAHIVLDHEGGKGAVRELCELILMRQGVRMPVTSV